jgi:hypothetical protein
VISNTDKRTKKLDGDREKKRVKKLCQYFGIDSQKNISDKTIMIIIIKKKKKNDNTAHKMRNKK